MVTFYENSKNETHSYKDEYTTPHPLHKCKCVTEIEPTSLWIKPPEVLKVPGRE